MKLVLEFAWAQEMLAEVSFLLQPELPPELRDRVLGFLDSRAEMFRLDSKIFSAERAGERQILLKPTDSFLELLLALRAWDRERVAAAPGGTAEITGATHLPGRPQSRMR